MRTCIVVSLLLAFIPPIPVLKAEERPRPRLEVPRVDGTLTIDGDLSEALWSGAALVDGFTEVDPDEGDPSDPRTEVKIMRNDTHLFVGFIAYEPEPGKIVLQDMHRDGIQMEDDAAKIAIDTFSDGKSGYYFLLSAAGGRLDATIADNGERLNFQWDGFWEARAQIFVDRWVAEFAIPFKTMAFGKEGVWRANFERWRGPDRSRHRWTGIPREFRVTTVSEGGELTGFTGIEEGYGLEFVPYFKAKRTRVHEPRRAVVTGDTGGEINWRITPQLTGSFTFNTDFAETEADLQRINLSRFPITFPEKRDFFLQDSTLFQFGWESPYGGRGTPTLLPYFSRKIGLSPDGEEIDIDYGVRVAGRVGDLDMGFLNVWTDELNSENIPEGDLLVARPAYRVTEELTVGGVVTSGDPASRDNNWVGGADVRYVSTDLLPGLFTLTGYYLRSDDEEINETGYGYGFRSTLETSDWEFDFDTIYGHKEFEPALGFVRRPGEKRYSGGIEWSPRPESDTVREYEFGIDSTFWTEPDGDIISKDITTTLFEVDWHDGDSFFVNHIYSFDDLEEVFEPVENHPIPPDDYDWQRIEAGYQFSQSRPLSGSLSYEDGGWYDGRSIEYRASGTWNPSAAFAVSVSYRQNRVKLDSGNFTTRIQSMRVNYDFSPDMRLETLVQGNNVSDEVGFQSRFRWIYKDGQELFFVVNSSWVDEEDGPFVPVEQDLILKIKYAVRF